MDIITLQNKRFAKYIDQSVIQKNIRIISGQINNIFKNSECVFLPVLNGAFMFAGDLIKSIQFNCEIHFVKLSSYKDTHSSLVVQEIIGLPDDLKNKSIVIVEDIIDTGLTIKYLLDQLHSKQVKDIRIATMFFKPEAFKEKYSIDYIGMEIKNDFIVGYGLDYNGYGRNLKDIYKMI